MKFLVAFVAVVAVAAAFRPMDSATVQLEAIVAAIASPNTDPATAAMLEQQLQEVLATLPVVQPAIADPAVISPTKPFVASDHLSPEVLEIMQAIASPNTDPATAAALSEMLIQSLGLDFDFAPIDISPAIVEIEPVPVIAPVVEPVPVITPVVEPVPVIAPVVEPVPVIAPVVKPVPVVTLPSSLNPEVQPTVTPAGVVAPVEASSADVSPLVQIILNINQASVAAPAVTPAVTPAGATEVVAPVTPVTVVDVVPVSPVIVVDSVSPVVVVDELPVAPVNVVDVVPVSPVVVVEPAVDPVSVADPIMPVPAVILPEILN